MQTRAFSYISDVAPHIAKSVDIPEAYNEVFNIGADKEYTVKELAETVMKVMGMEGKLRFLPPRNEVLHAYSDHSKAARVFGEGENLSLEEGITRMKDWVMKAGSRKTLQSARRCASDRRHDCAGQRIAGRYQLLTRRADSGKHTYLERRRVKIRRRLPSHYCYNLLRDISHRVSDHYCRSRTWRSLSTH